MAVADPLSGGRKSVAEGLSRAAVMAIACGAFIVLVSFGIRSGFGLFLQPMSLDLGWGREVFALAMALQNLLWGLSQPFAGAIADKWGTARTIIGGGVLYVLGVYLMSTTSSPPSCCWRSARSPWCSRPVACAAGSRRPATASRPSARRSPRRAVTPAI